MYHVFKMNQRRTERQVPLEKKIARKLVYQEILIEERGEKKLNQMEDLLVNTDRFQYRQIKNVFDVDKNKYGFKEKNSEL